MSRSLLISFLTILSSLSLLGQSDHTKKLSISLQSGVSMGRWIYDKGASTDIDGGHLGYDRSHLAVYIPAGIQLNYDWKKWGVGVEANIAWLSDDELISSTSKPLVPREYFITDGSAIRFANVSVILERTLLDFPRYKLQTSVFLGTFRSRQDHPRENFFGRHILLDIGLDNQIFLNDSWFIMLRPIFRRKYIATNDSPFKGESHEILTFGLDYGFGVFLF